MNILEIKAEPAKKAKTKESQQVAMFVGIVIAVMAFCQLVTLPQFINIVYDFHLFDSHSNAAGFVATLLVFELLSLPFLFRLKISQGLRGVSMIAGWLVALTWLFLSKWAWLYPEVTTNQSGMFGEVLPLVSGVWTVAFAGMIAVALAWASWGNWPVDRPIKLRLKKSGKKSGKKTTKKSAVKKSAKKA